VSIHYARRLRHVRSDVTRSAPAAPLFSDSCSLGSQAQKQLYTANERTLKIVEFVCNVM